jgi:MFS transporter, OFA family, oxalate/formate antiporter
MEEGIWGMLPAVLSTKSKNFMNNGWKVTFAGAGVNLALGLLYSWSVIAKYLRSEMGWSATETQLPYMIACGMFAVLMIPGGYVQDRIGPRLVIVASSIFAGMGLIGSSLFMTVTGLTVFFGFFFGTSMGLGYSSTTPPALKWFGPNKRGLVTGLVVSGFGLASVYAAPLTEYFLGKFGIQSTFLVLGISVFAVVMLLAQLIKDPPAGYNHQAGTSVSRKEKQKAVTGNFEWREVIKMPHFYLLWLMFCFSSLAGLMIIGQLSSIAYEQSGVSLGFVLVAVLAVFNAGGRIAGGVLFDKLGVNTLFVIFGLQATNFFLFSSYTALPTLLLGTVIAGFCYGTCLSIFPAMTVSLFGIKNLGINYGLIFTAWGAGGVFGGLIGGWVRDVFGSYLNAYLLAAFLSLVGLVLVFAIRSVRLPQAASNKSVITDVAYG